MVSAWSSSAGAETVSVSLSRVLSDDTFPSPPSEWKQ